MDKPTILLLTGPLLLGSLLSFFLDGAFAMQIYHYYMNYASTDRRFFVYLVAVVTLVEILHMILSTHTTYTLLAAGFGDPSVLATAPWSGAGLPALNGTVGFCTQLFFSWRIVVLTDSIFGKVAAGIILLTGGMQMAAAFGVSIQFALLKNNVQALASLDKTVTVWLAGSFTCDMLISIAMVAILLHARGATTYSASKGLLSALIRHTIENGVITTACALADLIAYLRFGNTWFYICFEYLLGRLYASVLLATLNGRKRMRLTATNEHEFSAMSATSKSATNQVQLSAFRSYQAPTGQSSKTYPVVSVTTDVQIDDGRSPESKSVYP